MTLGFEEVLFWSLTPRQLQNHFKAEVERLKSEHRRQMAYVWHAAMLRRVKTIPSLDELLGDAKPSPPKQTWQEMRANLRSHLAVIDGRAPQRGAK